MKNIIKFALPVIALFAIAFFVIRPMILSKDQQEEEAVRG